MRDDRGDFSWTMVFVLVFLSVVIGALLGEALVWWTTP